MYAADLISLKTTNYNLKVALEQKSGNQQN